MLKLFKALRKGTQKDACKECDYYNPANGTCKSKKCSTGNPYVTNFDRKHCKPYHECDTFKELTQKWIPCSERLPKKSGQYLVTRGPDTFGCGSLWNRVYIVNYSDLMGLKKEKIWWSGNVGKSDFEKYDDVLAWMPLPLPYDGENQ